MIPSVDVLFSVSQLQASNLLRYWLYECQNVF